MPSADGTAAGRVGEVLTTSTSPASRKRARSAARAWVERARGPLGDEHAHVVAAAAVGLDGVVGDEVGGHLDVERPGRGARAAVITPPPAGPGTSVTW